MSATPIETAQREHKQQADVVFGLFVPFAQGILKQDKPEISTPLLHQTLSAITEMPPGYFEERLFEERLIDDQKVTLGEITQSEHQEGRGWAGFPLKIMQLKTTDRHEVEVRIVVREDRSDAMVGVRESDRDWSWAYYQKPITSNQWVPSPAPDSKM